MDICILGGGSSGCIAAIVAKRNGGNVTIFEHTDKILKKLSSTGNGKCNFTNMNIEPSAYHTDEASPIIKTLNSFSNLDTINFFKGIGIEAYDRNGYIYPVSEQASAVCEALKNEINRLKIRVKYNIEVKSIKCADNKVYMQATDKEYIFDKIIIACGSKAYANFGSDGSGYLLAEKMGFKVNKPLASLCAMYIRDKKNIEAAKGVRVRADISLFIDDEYIISEYGELQITDYGLSGIPVFQISRYASIALNKNKKVSVKIDFLPNIDNKASFIKNRLKIDNIISAKDIGIGIINDKLWKLILKKSNISESISKESLSKKDTQAIIKNISAMKFDIEKMADFSKAQVCCGGIDLAHINPYTMQSDLYPEIFFAGEILDADGICGGYNLQWAWSSGFLAGKYAARIGELNDKD